LAGSVLARTDPAIPANGGRDRGHGTAFVVKPPCVGLLVLVLNHSQTTTISERGHFWFRKRAGVEAGQKKTTHTKTPKNYNINGKKKKNRRPMAPRLRAMHSEVSITPRLRFALLVRAARSYSAELPGGTTRTGGYIVGAFAPAEQGSPRAGRRARRRRAAKKKKRTGEIYEPPPYAHKYNTP
jgi:hypothetical protein